jgi:hypothetical protein
MKRNLGTAHPVEIPDELRKAIDPEVAPASTGRPMHSVPDARNSSQPCSSRDEVPQAPVGSDEQGDAQLRMSIEKAFQATERTACEVAAGLVLVTGSGGMNIIDAKADRTAHSLRQPIGARAQLPR